MERTFYIRRLLGIGRTYNEIATKGRGAESREALVS
jgi:hypothetical protein